MGLSGPLARPPFHNTSDLFRPGQSGDLDVWKSPCVKLLLFYFQEKKKHINNNKCMGLSWDWVGGKSLFMCFFFFMSFLMGEKTHINKIPPKIPGPVKILCIRSFDKGLAGGGW